MKLLVVLISFAIVMIFLVSLAIMLERYWRKHQAAQAANQVESEAAGSPLADSVTRVTEQLRSLFQPQQENKPLANQFREWVTSDLRTDKDIQSWLLALPEPGFAMLTQHIAAFCTEMNFDLQWLVKEQAAIAPELKAAMQSVVVDYCRACQKSVFVQTHAKAFAEYQRLQQNPKGKQEQALSRTLYANLVHEGLAPMPDAAETINATESERQQQAQQMIQQAAAKDWARFAQVLQATLTPIAAAPMPENGNAGDDNGKNGNGKNSDVAPKGNANEEKVMA